MTLWLDAQLPPQLASWIQQTLTINAIALRDLGLRDANDSAIFDAAKKANVVLISKNSDFVELVMRHGAPPKLNWLNQRGQRQLFYGNLMLCLGVPAFS